MFGPVIIVMLLFNLLATIILMTAAWVGTDSVWEADQARKRAGKLAGIDADIEVLIDEETELAAERASKRWAASKSLDDLRRADETAIPEITREDYVRQDVAKRTVSAGLGLGYGIGAATGLGLGALVARLLGRK